VPKIRQEQLATGRVRRPPDGLQELVAEELGEDGRVLVIEDTGFMKKGTTSAGVQRQHSGTAGRTDDYQIGAFGTIRGRWSPGTVQVQVLIRRPLPLTRRRCPTRGAHRQMSLPKAIVLCAPRR
jgi:hypothetical protein